MLIMQTFVCLNRLYLMHNIFCISICFYKTERKIK